jgi:phage terminase large subunit
MSTKEMELAIEGTELLEITLANKAKVLIHKGGTSSSKTVSIAQAHIIWSFEEVGKTYSVVRKTLPALRRGALKDFKMALALAGCEPWFMENKSDLTFTNRQTGTVIEFFAIDNPQKARGPRRDRLWCNEGNELDLEDWRQLTMRTRERILLDYNPSMLQHWIYTEVETRADCQVIHSTYQDNPFLTAGNIREIEVDLPVYQLPDGRLYTDWAGTYEGKGTLVAGDPFRWAVFGLGQRGAASETIYKVLYESAGLTPGRSRQLGLDFGFNHATVLTDLEYRDMPGKAELHIDELIHQSYLTSDDLLKMLPEVGVFKRDEIAADGARPEMIEALKRSGYNIRAADKGPGSVKEGIDKLKSVKLCFTRRSKKTKDQFQMYRWKKTSSGQILDEPIKFEDDGPDAVRYGAIDLIKQRTAPRRRMSAPVTIR